MAVMAKPINRLPIIDGNKLKEFLEFSNSGIQEFLEECYESAELFEDEDDDEQ